MQYLCKNYAKKYFKRSKKILFLYAIYMQILCRKYAKKKYIGILYRWLIINV